MKSEEFSPCLRTFELFSPLLLIMRIVLGKLKLFNCNVRKSKKYNINNSEIIWNKNCEFRLFPSFWIIIVVSFDSVNSSNDHKLFSIFLIVSENSMNSLESWV